MAVVSQSSCRPLSGFCEVCFAYAGLTLAPHPGSQTISERSSDVSAKLSVALLLSRPRPRSPREAHLSERSMQNKAPASISRARRCPPLPRLAHPRGETFFHVTFESLILFFFPHPPSLYEPL